jgi:hypothetical protein
MNTVGSFQAAEDLIIRREELYQRNSFLTFSLGFYLNYKEGFKTVIGMKYAAVVFQKFRQNSSDFAESA